MTRRLAGLASVLALLMCASCGGLPTPQGVRSAENVQAEQTGSPGLQVLPPGPREGATAKELVTGFLDAQSSPEDDYAVARQFLAPGTEWDPSASALLYRAGTQDVDAPEPGVARVGLRVVGQISGAGAFSLRDEKVTDDYRIVRDKDGQLRLSGVPAGVRLADIDRTRSFVPRNVYFLGLPAPGESTPHLVADRVFQLSTADPARALVQALLSGPTAALNPPGQSGAVETAVPPGTRLRGVAVRDNVVRVDLSREVLTLDATGRQRLSAQLVWTLLPAYRGVELLVEGKPLPVSGTGAVQVRDDWAAYGPSGLGPDAPLLYVAGRRLRMLDGQLPASDVTGADGIPVDRAALAPGQRALGVLTDGAGAAPDVVRTGPVTGPFTEALSKPGLTSLTWGSGGWGLWLLQAGRDPLVRDPLIWLAPGPGAPPTARARTIDYEPPPGAGPLAAIVASRDGARMAMVFGVGTARRLYVGRIELSGGRPVVRRVLAVAPAMTGVVDVAWESDTSLVAFGSLKPTSEVLGLRVAIDGSSLTPLNTSGLPTGGAISIAAAPDDNPLVVGVDVGGKRSLYRPRDGLFVDEGPGTAPFYPG